MRTYVETRIATLQRGNPTQRLVDVALQGEDEALRLHFALNPERLAAVQALDGRYALATNGAHLSAEQALTLFKGQDGVEKCFRSVKVPLVFQPLFVRTDHRIEGLVFMTLLALLVRAILVRCCRQHDLTLTADQALHRFANLQAVDVTWADSSLQRRAAQMSEFQAQALAALGWPLPETYAHLPSEGADADL